MSILPNKIGDLIRLAVKDLEACEANPAYDIEMGEWHTYIAVDDVCLVCLAGSVMAQSLPANRTTYMSPSCFPDEIRNKLGFLNFCRSLSSDNPEVIHYLRHNTFKNYDKLVESEKFDAPVSYDVNPDQFKASLLALADLMDKHDVHYIGD